MRCYSASDNNLEPGIIKVDKYVEDAVSGGKVTSPADTPAGLEPFAVEETKRVEQSGERGFQLSCREAIISSEASQTRYSLIGGLPVHKAINTDKN